MLGMNLTAFVEAIYRGEQVNFYRASGGGAASEESMVAQATGESDILQVNYMTLSVSGAALVTIEGKGASDSVTLYKVNMPAAGHWYWPCPVRARQGDAIVLTTSADVVVSCTMSVTRRVDATPGGFVASPD